MPVATGGARPDIIGIGIAPVLTGSTHTGVSAGMAVAGIARARKTSALMSAFARTCPLVLQLRTKAGAVALLNCALQTDYRISL